ncbi:hypothetical protein D3C72_1202250 [compost metagenome]
MVLTGAWIFPFSTQKVAKRVRPVMRAAGRSEKFRYQRLLMYRPVSRRVRICSCASSPAAMLSAQGDSWPSAPLASSSNSAALRAQINRSRPWPCSIKRKSLRGAPSSENAGLSEPLTCSAMLTIGLSRASLAYRRCSGLFLVASD